MVVKMNKAERVEFLIKNLHVDFSKDFFAQTNEIACWLQCFAKEDGYRYRNPNHTLRQSYYYSLQRCYNKNKAYFDSLDK